MTTLTAEELEFVVWALSYVESVALEMHDDRTGYRANFIAEKLRERAAEATEAEDAP